MRIFFFFFFLFSSSSSSFSQVRRNELAMSYVEGVADKFGGDVAHAMRASHSGAPPLLPAGTSPMASSSRGGSAGLMQSRGGGPGVSSSAKGGFGGSFGGGSSVRRSNERKSGESPSVLSSLSLRSGGRPPVSSTRSTSRGSSSARTVEDILAEHKEKSSLRRSNN